MEMYRVTVSYSMDAESGASSSSFVVPVEGAFDVIEETIRTTLAGAMPYHLILEMEQVGPLIEGVA